MSKLSFTIALILSVAIHVVLFMPGRATDHKVAKSDKLDKGKLVVIPPPPVEEMPEETIDPPVAPEPEPVEPPRLAEVVKPSAESPTESSGDLATDEIPDDALPTLRILWTSSNEVREVARALAMRIVAIDADSQVVGELVLYGEPRIEPFQGSFRGYSNRVRSLPKNFFGPGLLGDRNSQVIGFWILIPTALDQRFADLQREIIRRKSLQPSDVRAMEARFVLNDRGKYELRITEVHA